VTKPLPTCEACPLFLAPGPVNASGPEDAKIMFVGEAPGEVEVNYPNYKPERMKPFIGGSGRILYALCKNAGIFRDETRVVNVVRCRPPDNRTPTHVEIQACAPLLIKEIEECNPNVIIALGETALNLLTPKKGISTYRGIATKGFQDRKVFPTWHPAFIMRMQHNWGFAVHDLIRAKAESEFPEIRRVPFEIIRQADYTTTLSDCMSDIRGSGTCTFDFETTGLSAKSSEIRMCGFTGRPDKAYVYDWTVGAQQLLEKVFADPKIEVCGQNILAFDMPFAEDKGVKIDWTGKIFDLMVAFHLCNSSYGQTTIGEQRKSGSWQGGRGTEKDLAFIASLHTDMEYWKGKEEYKSDLYTVCGKDVIGTSRAAYNTENGIRLELKNQDMEDLYYKHVLPVHMPLRRMHQRGFKIHTDRAARWSIIMEREAEQLEKALQDGLGNPSLNLNSPKQMMHLFYETLKLPIQYTKDTKTHKLRPTANAEAIATLASLSPDNAILGTVVDIRHLKKLNSTYVIPALRAGVIHPNFGVSKASNGRFNSQNPNVQNVPEDMRDMWIPTRPYHNEC